MNVLIDNQDLNTVFNVIVLDYTGALSFPSERSNERVWNDKSGVDRNLENIKYESKEFVLSCLVKAGNEVEAYNLVKVLIDYMYLKGIFVLSLRDVTKGVRECFICERSSTIVGDINIREQNSLYSFKLGLKDINPKAVKYKTSIVGNTVIVLYDKGQTATIYWGNGDRGLVSNSGNYEKTDYSGDGLVDVTIDIDSDADIVEPLVAEFSADILNGVKPQDIQFTDDSLGTVEIWSWDFGDGNTSDEQDPSHIYTSEGTYTVTLQVFNSAKGSDTNVKIDYITIRNARMLVNDSGDFALVNNSGDFGILN